MSRHFWVLLHRWAGLVMATFLIIVAVTGSLLAFYTGEFKFILLPSGQYTGNTVTSWLYALHMGNIFGLSYRIIVCILGLVIAMLSVTGIIIWMKKRQARTSLHLS